jgi:tetratricopeptide (TPR) repeat protein
VTGLVVDDAAVELVAGERRIGSRRPLQDADVELLSGLGQRYVRAVRAGFRSAGQPGAHQDEFVAIGRELFGWLDGDQGQLSGLLEQARRPLVFEVRGSRTPSERAWAVLRAPFELLARPDGGFLAEDAIIRFCVARRLGAPEAPPPLDGYRLGLAFMASSPRGQHELDYEHEEAAILGAVGENRVDLVVDDTGDPEQLAHRLADLGGLPAVHLSCHGLNNWRARAGEPCVPVLLMEDDAGAGRPTTAGDLVSLLTVRPRLLFVSACLTATGADATGHLPPGEEHKSDPAAGEGSRGGAVVGEGPVLGGEDPVSDEADRAAALDGGLAAQDGDDLKAGDGDGGNGTGLVAHSMATALVAAGTPAVIGWDGSVGDRAATAFAERLYRGLADREDLAVAVGEARRALLGAQDPHVRADWHLARLWLGPDGGGPLVGGTKRRSMVPALHGTKAFLDRKSLVPVAAAQMFVGRRHELQRALRVLRAGDHAGILLHGQGRLGKSSLAARIADRMPDHVLAVVFGDYTALGVLDAVAAAVRANREARELIESRLAEVRQRPEALEAVLVDLLAGPLSQRAGDRQRPLLLVIDDLEQILVPNPAGPRRVAGTSAPVIAAVLRAFDPAETDSRLIVTSRFTFTLDGLEGRLAAVQLPPLSVTAQRKLLLRQRAAAPAARQAGRSALAARSLAVSRGNPGLQDLIGLRLVYGEQVSDDRAAAVVTEMESYLRRGSLPSEPEVRSFLENLALDALLEEAGPANVELLRAVTLFDLPVPEPVTAALAGETGGSPDRLRGLGLLDPYEDPYDPTWPASAVNPLAVGRIDPLTGDERTALAGVTIAPLFTAWGGEGGRSRRDAALDLQLTQVGMLADDPASVAACAGDAVNALRSGPAASALRLGQDAIELLDRHGCAVPLALLRQAADAAFTSGDGDAGEAMLNRAVQRAERGEAQASDPLERARVIAEQGRRLITRGDPQQAEQLLWQAHQEFTAAASEREAAAAMGEIAEIAYRRGDYDEALRIWREVELPVYERLGEARSAAVTWGKIADVAFDRGDYEEALRIRREVQLPVYERLGEARSAAVTWGKIADVVYRRGDYDEVLRIRREVQLPVYERLGDAQSAAVAWGQIADIAFQRGEYDEAARLQQRRLEVNKQLGDLDGIAAADWDLAQIDLQRQDFEAAFPRLAESFQILLRLQRPDGITTVGGVLGQLLMALGANDQARGVLAVSMVAARKLGWEDDVRQIQELLDSLPPAERTDSGEAELPSGAAGLLRGVLSCKRSQLPFGLLGKPGTCAPVQGGARVRALARARRGVWRSSRRRCGRRPSSR